MSEPKWWPKGEIPTEDGFFISINEGNTRSSTSWDFPGEIKHIMLSDSGKPYRQFYGPIPDPPKDPLKLMQFTANHEEIGFVSGVRVAEKEDLLKFQIFYLRGSTLHAKWCERGEFIGEIKWLDKEAAK